MRSRARVPTRRPATIAAGCLSPWRFPVASRAGVDARSRFATAKSYPGAQAIEASLDNGWISP